MTSEIPKLSDTGKEILKTLWTESLRGKEIILKTSIDSAHELREHIQPLLEHDLVSTKSSLDDNKILSARFWTNPGYAKFVLQRQR